MNRKGQAFFVALMIAVTFIIVALALASPIQSFVTNARNASTDNQVGLDCGNTSINMYTKANCVAVDLLNPYFIGFLIFVAGVIISAKFVVAKNE